MIDLLDFVLIVAPATLVLAHTIVESKHHYLKQQELTKLIFDIAELQNEHINNLNERLKKLENK